MNNNVLSPRADSGQAFDRWVSVIDTLMSNIPLFTTNAENLFEVYLDSLPEDQRQHHNCHCCRSFIEKYGSLVYIKADGTTMPAIWDSEFRHLPECYQVAAENLNEVVRKAKVTGVFYDSNKIWGTPVTGPWTHFAVRNPNAVRKNNHLHTDFQASAAKTQDFLTVRSALQEYDLPLLNKLVAMLEVDLLFRSEKLIGPAKWLRDLSQTRHDTPARQRNNVIWLAVATAPDGFCHPRASVLGTMLDDLKSGMSVEQVAKRINDKMNPLQYQRPQALPTAQAVKRAEELVEKMGISRSLERRMASVKDLRPLWVPPPLAASSRLEQGVFSKVKTKEAPEEAGTVLPGVTMTWVKFRDQVLTTAESIEVYLGNFRHHLGGFVTAAHEDAPPILQWDSEESRNPVSWYLRIPASMPQQFSLEPGKYHNISAVTLLPCAWQSGFDHFGNMVAFVIQGGRDTMRSNSRIFPETLKSELREVRSVIEQYTKSTPVGDSGSDEAVGVFLGSGQPQSGFQIVSSIRLKVVSRGLVHHITLDRWD